MTKLTALELYVVIDTLLHSLSHGKHWTGSATEEARDNVFRKLQSVMNEITVDLTVEDSND
jgi:hypothetical protein